MSHPPSAKTSECRRCGTCCRKGGPALHVEDRRLVEEGTIPLKHLYTLRAGEPAHDNVRDVLAPVPGDVIKIRERGGGRACRYLDPADNSCTIYPHRPAECRALTCWDTSRIKALYDRDRLTRRDLLTAAGELRELVDTHQRRCDYHLLARLAAAYRADPRDRRAEPILEMVRYDYHLRERFRQRSPALADTLDFLCGRALSLTVRGFGIRLRSIDGRLHLEPLGTAEGSRVS